ncbi:MAG: TonB-dependent receptor [Gammaproteobacteria bacterium]|nr:TonB-dependent receptor [Gammaproteobacteria bacterium]
MDVDRFGRRARVAVVWAACAITCSAHAQGGESAEARADEEVVATGRRGDAPTEPTAMTEKLVKVAGTLGDPFRALTALPGVLQPSEGGGELAVRGSSPDDNSFLIDGLPAGYVFHDFGNSIFNEDIVRDFGFAPAGFGARYGEASGALLDIQLREPRNEDLAATLDVSLLRAGVLAESRITDNQAFYVSFRESLLHLLLDAAYSEEQRIEDDITIERYPRARDFQAKYTWDAGPNHSLAVVVIGARDDAAATFGARSETALVDPGASGTAATTTAFASAGVSWIYRRDGFAVTTRIGRLSRSDDQARGSGNEYIDLDVDQLTAKSTVELAAGPRQRLAFGVERRHYAYDYAVRFRYRSCTAFSPDCDTNLGDLTESDREQPIGVTEAFVENRWSPASSVDVTTGIRYSRDDYLGDRFLEPRFAATWRRSPRWEFRAAWGRYHQLPEIVQIVPVFGNPALRPLEAEHSVLGLTRTLDEDWSVTAEVYYKKLDDLVVEAGAPTNYVNGATGEARGVELMISRESAGRWYGWATLSLARTERTNALRGDTARFDTDTPLIANLVLSYRLTPSWTAGLRWQYRSGLPYTPIVGNEENPDYPGFYRPVYGDLNAERADDYHRLDLRFERPIRIGRAQGFFYIDVVNAYGRRNTGAASYEPVPDSADYRLVEDDGLPFLPSVGVKLTL